MEVNCQICTLNEWCVRTGIEYLPCECTCRDPGPGFLPKYHYELEDHGEGTDISYRFGVSDK